MRQTELNEFESTEVPYPVPYPGSEGSARAEHRKWYWSKYDRESYECPDCGRGIKDVLYFDVHHIDENPLNGNPDNLIAVCRRCHGRRHSDVKHISSLTVDEWKKEFLNSSQSEYVT